MTTSSTDDLPENDGRHAAGDAGHRPVRSGVVITDDAIRCCPIPSHPLPNTDETVPTRHTRRGKLDGVSYPGATGSI